MRKNNTQKIDEIVRQYLKALGVDGKLREVRLVKSWDDVVGKTIAKSTRNIYIKDRKLFVELRSSVIRNELFLIREQLCEVLNEKAGESVINEIVLK